MTSQQHLWQAAPCAGSPRSAQLVSLRGFSRAAQESTPSRLHSQHSTHSLAAAHSSSSSSRCQSHLAGMRICSVRAGAVPAGQEEGSAADLAPGELDRYADVAKRCAEAAAATTLKYFRSKELRVDAKADTSPVTRADREAETAMRAVVEREFPEHAVYGEEAGFSRGQGSNGADSPFLWVFDPIDGTKSFITGKPTWTTLVALLHEGRPVLGLIDQPASREQWLGLEGRPTTHNGKPCRVRECPDLGSAYLYATSPHIFGGESAAAFDALREEARCALYGCDAYAYGLLALGCCDLVAEATLRPYDYLAHVPVVRGAGGRLTDWLGQEVRWRRSPSGLYEVHTMPEEVLAAGDARTHAAALEKLAWQRRLDGEEPAAEPTWAST